jgi:hypothetical protein
MALSETAINWKPTVLSPSHGWGILLFPLGFRVLFACLLFES